MALSSRQPIAAVEFRKLCNGSMFVASATSESSAAWTAWGVHIDHAAFLSRKRLRRSAYNQATTIHFQAVGNKAFKVLSTSLLGKHPSRLLQKWPTAVLSPVPVEASD